MNVSLSQLWKTVSLSLAVATTALLLAACQTNRSGGEGVPTFDQDTGAPTNVPGPDTGGKGTNSTSIPLRPNEMLQIIFTDSPIELRPFEGRIKEDGAITLMENQVFTAAGKTTGQLEQEIHDRYVPKYYRKLTATVRTQDRFFYVTGRVRMAGRLEWRGDITLMGAISAAGGFDDFAKETNVQIIRGNKKLTVDCKKLKGGRSELDVPIYPGDRIIVPKKFW